MKSVTNSSKMKERRKKVVIEVWNGVRLNNDMKQIGSEKKVRMKWTEIKVLTTLHVPHTGFEPPTSRSPCMGFNMLHHWSYSTTGPEHHRATRAKNGRYQMYVRRRYNVWLTLRHNNKYIFRIIDSQLAL